MRTERLICLGAIALAIALCGPQAADAHGVSPLPASNYSVRPACATASRGYARCFAVRLVAQTAAARARRNPIGMTRRTPITAGTAAEGADGLRPGDLHSAYSVPTTSPADQTIALVDAFNDPEAENDLKVYDEEFGLPACTAANGCFRQLNQEGATSPLPATEGGWSLEISLDIEVAHATCQNCHIVLVEAKNSSLTNLEAAEDTAAAAGATEISNSWGGAPPGAENPAFDHPGIAVTAATGDDGYLNWDGKADERGYANYPATSPDVVAVGGTRLTLSGPSNTWKSETVWNGQGATGGGCAGSQFAADPWESELSNWPAVGCGADRGGADIAADADPYTGVAVYDTVPDEGRVPGWEPVGGTSLSSPLIASLFALAGGAHGAAHPAQMLYENALENPGSLHDVQLGSNGACSRGYNFEGLSRCTTAEEAASCSDGAICTAGPGYDGPSGVGTPDGIRAFEAADPPSATSEPASSVGQSTATLNATVDPDGKNVTACRFEYGPSTGYGASVPCATLPGAGREAVAVAAELVGLAGETLYHFRVAATNASGTAYGADQTFTTAAGPPTVTRLAPDAGLQSGSTTVTVAGTDLAGATEVQFGLVDALFFEVQSPSSITADSPAGTGVVAVTVTTPTGTSTSVAGDQFTYVAAAPEPTIKKLAPKKGPASGGSTVTITGTGYAGVTAVRFGATNAASFVVNSPTSITAVTPEGAPGKVEVTVTTPNGTDPASTGADFTFKKVKGS
ncbi:MAG TPA: IPT/TIG domain-containing protein [Solirubrobacteraceae bacterium]|nr:IPT/TIG domain-containing protein [Solirubrobacteraceae bacterium]